MKRRPPVPTPDQVRLMLRSARTSYISALVKAHEALDDGRRADLLAEAERLDAQIDQLEQLQARLETKEEESLAYQQRMVAAMDRLRDYETQGSHRPPAHRGWVA